MKYILVCAWCGEVLKEEEREELKENFLSHGICEECKEKILKKWKEEMKMIDKGRFNFRTRDGELYGVEYRENKYSYVYRLAPVFDKVVFKNDAQKRLEQLRDSLDPMIDYLIEGLPILVLKNKDKEVTV